MKPDFEKILPNEIEKRSFEIITEELHGRQFSPLEEPVIKRCIHASADFDYADSLCFSENAVSLALTAIKNGCDIVTDTQMAKAGINKKKLAEFGGKVFCHMADEDVAELAKKEGVTRACISIRKAVSLSDRQTIFAIGNAPTALMELYRFIGQGLLPALIIGVPVGFVNVIQAKELIMSAPAPYIVARGRKGGSNIAAAIVNALLYQL